MGGNFSSLPQAPPNFPYFSLTFRMQDKIKMTLADNQVVGVIRNAVTQCWNPGIQVDGVDKDGSYEIKFNGLPFCKAGSHESAIQSKRVCCKALSDLHALGWRLMVCSDLSRTTDLTTWFFQKAAVESKPQLMICVSLSSQDSLQLINAPESMRAVFKEAVAAGYSYGIQEERPYGQDYELKLRGYPWNSANLEEGVFARRLLLEIFRRFDQHRFQFYGTANLKGTADCIFFIYDEHQTPGACQYMMVSLNQNDRIRLIDAPQNVIDCTRQIITQYWRNGLQAESNLNLAWEFKLKGYPWWSDGPDSVTSRFVMTMLFQSLLSVGWCVVTSLDISRRLNDKGVFVMKTCQPASLMHFCVSLNETDKIRLINAPQDMPNIIRQVFAEGWPYGVQRESNYYGSHEFKLNASPWSSYGGNEYLVARCMMCLMMRALMERGWRVVCSADVSAKYHASDNGPDYPLDVHSWFIVYTGNTRAPNVTTGALPGPEPPNPDGTLPTYSDLYGRT